jgi:uncharacterized protein (DUF433 family)
MNLDRITIIPDLCGGEPTIRGLRITASQVLEMLAGGMKPEEILQDFPYLEQADINACLEYAARHAAHREISLSK